MNDDDIIKLHQKFVEAIGCHDSLSKKNKKNEDEIFHEISIAFALSMASFLLYHGVTNVGGWLNEMKDTIRGQMEKKVGARLYFKDGEKIAEKPTSESIN